MECQNECARLEDVKLAKERGIEEDYQQLLVDKEEHESALDR